MCRRCDSDKNDELRQCLVRTCVRLFDTNRTGEPIRMTLKQATRLILLIAVASVSIAVNPAGAADLDLSAYKGKVVYLDFWASWCNPCRQSFPWMNELQQRYGANGLVVLAVNVDHDRADAEDFLRSYDPSFKVVFDPGGSIAQQYNLKDMPTSVLIGRDGKVHFVHNGFYPDQEMAYAGHVWSLLQQGRNP